MASDKVRYPGTGCIVEFMQGNAPFIGFVQEAQGDKLRLYTQAKRETSLQSSRLLPWSGPMAGVNLSRQHMDEVIEEKRHLREQLAEAVDVQELWECIQGEAEKASVATLAGLVWEDPGVDHEAALARVLFKHKTHFRFATPDFEIFSEEVVKQRLTEAHAQQLREAVAGEGAALFHALWERHIGKKTAAPRLHTENTETEALLKRILLKRIADPDTSEDEALWKLLVKGLPEHPYLALCLAMAWDLVPYHHNAFLDRVGYEKGEAWAEPFSAECAQLRESVLKNVCSLQEFPPQGSAVPPLISLDPTSTVDRDDAISVYLEPSGAFHLVVAIAAPALNWPFDGPFDKAVTRRASSIYLPEGDEHMLPAAAGWQCFSLDAQQQRAAMIIQVAFSPEGVQQGVEVSINQIRCAKNLTLAQSEEALAAHPDSLRNKPSSSGFGDLPADWSAMLAEEEQALHEVNYPTALPETHPAAPYSATLSAAFQLATLLQQRRVERGAVITERPMPELTLHGTGRDTTVAFSEEPQTPLSFMLVGELMVAANNAVATWAQHHNVPLFFRTQDVGLPKEYAGVWSAPHDIARVIRALPPSSLEVTPKKHAGLGSEAYTSCTAPIRRYVDLLNQGQILSFLTTGAARFSQEALQSKLPLINARADAANGVQRMRPRYWKLLYFFQQGDKQWWDAVITEENSAFVTVALPFAQLYLRGRRNLFDDKISLGQTLGIRIGKVNPLLNEIHILETREM